MIAAYGRCDDEVALPYQPLVAALGELVTRAPTGLLSEYAREFGGELSRFVPALSRRLPWLPPPQAADAETERHLFFDAAAGLLAHLTAERPLLLVVDDLHWAERETLRLLRYLVDSVEGRPVLVVLAYRSAEVGVDTPLADLLGLMRRREDVTVLSLAGLSGAEAVPLVELLTGRTGSDARHLAERVAEETGGNPLFTLELLRHLVEQREGGDGFDDMAVLPLPDSVRDVVERRVARLGPAATELLQQAAVVGMSFDLDVLASTVDADADEVLDTLEQARQAHLVEETDVSGRFSFTHALVAHALVQGFSATRLERLHLRVAQTIEELHGEESGPYLTELAAHLVAAGAVADPALVLRVARAAGDQALAGLAPDEAVRWYQLALERVPRDEPGERVDVLVQLGVAQRQAAKLEHRETLLEAARLADDLGDADRLAAAALANGRGDRSRTHFVDRDRVATLERALAVLSPEDSPERARLLAQLAQETIHAPDADLRLTRADQALAMARRLGDPSTLADVLLMRYEATRVPHTLPARLAETAELVELAEQLGDPRRTAFAHMWRSRACLEAGDVAGLDRHARQAWALSEKVGSPYLRWNLISHFAHRAYLDGDLAEADRLAFECFAAGEGEPDARPVLASQLIAFRAAQDRLGEMIPAAEHDVARRPELVAVELALAWMYAQVGGPDPRAKARAILDRHLADGFAGVRYDILWMQVMAYAAETAARVGHVAAAADVADRLRPWADQVVWSGTIAMGPVSWLLGLLATTTGRPEEALDPVGGGPCDQRTGRRAAVAGPRRRRRGGGADGRRRHGGGGATGGASAGDRRPPRVRRDRTRSRPHRGGRTMTDRTRVLVLGGGVGGMTAAHELAERGFDVLVLDARDIPGGKARSMPAKGTGTPPEPGAPDRPDLPAEHGFRFFPGFYVHVPDTMGRIPFGDNERGVLDNLRSSTRAEMARAGQRPLVMPARFPRSVADVRLIVQAMRHSDLGIPVRDMAHFAGRLLRLLTSCDERRYEQWEHESWWEFCGAATRSEAYQKYLATGLTRTLVAAQADKISARTGGYILLQLVFDMLEPSQTVDRVLDGPTNDRWIDPWLAHLRALGVEYRSNATVTAIHCDGERITGVDVDEGAGPTTISADWYVAAMPVEEFAPLVTEEMRVAEPLLGSLGQLQTRWMNGIIYYLRTDIPLVNGHTIYIDSPWALTSISQPQFWEGIDIAGMGRRRGPRDPVRRRLRLDDARSALRRPPGRRLHQGGGRRGGLAAAVRPPQRRRRGGAARGGPGRQLRRHRHRLPQPPPDDQPRAAAHQHRRLLGPPTRARHRDREPVPGGGLRPHVHRPGHDGGRQRGRPPGGERVARRDRLRRRALPHLEAARAAAVRPAAGPRPAGVPPPSPSARRDRTSGHGAAVTLAAGRHVALGLADRDATVGPPAGPRPLRARPPRRRVDRAAAPARGDQRRALDHHRPLARPGGRAGRTDPPLRGRLRR